MNHRTLLLLIFLHPLILCAQDTSQYPDTIIDSYNVLTKKSGQFFGGTIYKWGWIVPLQTRFHKSDTFVSLPLGSYVILGFTNNTIIDAPDQPDIFIEEVGGMGECAEILVSADNLEYTHLGIAGYGKINAFDLAKINFTKPVSYIKIIGQDAKGESPGFDLGNVYGLPGANQPIRENPIVLENVLFKTNKADLLPASFVSLDKLVLELQRQSSLKIEIRGHTDNVGKESDNQILSEARAHSVYEYLISKTIDQNRLSYKGFGSTIPIASNEEDEGRMKNRRVEFLILK